MKEVNGTVVKVSTQWWLKVNTKPLRKNAVDGAVFPHILQVAYQVNGKTYTKRKWIPAGRPVPEVGTSLAVLYDEIKPSKAKIF